MSIKHYRQTNGQNKLYTYLILVGQMKGTAENSWFPYTLHNRRMDRQTERKEYVTMRIITNDKNDNIHKNEVKEIR